MLKYNLQWRVIFIISVKYVLDTNITLFLTISMLNKWHNNVLKVWKCSVESWNENSGYVLILSLSLFVFVRNIQCTLSEFEKKNS